jgi:glycosyltransferase involved in cell wall biosynthesis
LEPFDAVRARIEVDVMRIAVIAPPWLPVPPPAYGGTELVLDGLCRGLAAAGHQVLLCTTGDSTCPVDRFWTYETALGTDSARPAAELSHVLDAYAAATTWGADLVHDHTIGGLAWGALSGLPIVTTNHGPFTGDLATIYRHTERHVPIIAISRHQASTSGDIPISAVIHHGIDLDQHKPGRGDGGYACFLGRMSPDKGVHTAIEVARRSGIPLKIAAKMREAPERAYFEAQVRPLLGGDIEYVGEVGGPDKAALLSGAVCLLNPIAWPEPFGMVMIEAQAHGTPVVVTPFGAAPELVDDGVTGFLRSTIDGLVEAVDEVTALDRVSCRRAVEQRFSIHRMAADHAAFYASRIEGGLDHGVVVTGGASP